MMTEFGKAYTPDTEKCVKVMLQRVAHCRSSDMGNVPSISVIECAPALYQCIKEQLTADCCKDFYSSVVAGPVPR